MARGEFSPQPGKYTTEKWKNLLLINLRLLNPSPIIYGYGLLVIFGDVSEIFSYVSITTEFWQKRFQWHPHLCQIYINLCLSLHILIVFLLTRMP